jgi:hypothetical protein
MNHRHSIIVLAVTALLAVSATAAVACDKSKSAAKSASATKTERSDSRSAAVTADARGACGTAKSAAVTADAKGACGFSKTTTAVAAGACAGKAGKTSAATAAHEGCASKTSTAQTAGWDTGNGRVDAVLTGGASCSGVAKGAGKTASKTGCEICDEYASCDEKLTIAGAVTQVVPLKNGVMFVYTSSAQNQTHAVQAAVHRRNDRIAEIAGNGAQVPLCDGCKSMRGAMASGKMKREVVNIEGGSLTLVTSDDPKVVKALQEYTGVQAVKS